MYTKLTQLVLATFFGTGLLASAVAQTIEFEGFPQGAFGNGVVNIEDGFELENIAGSAWGIDGLGNPDQALWVGWLNPVVVGDIFSIRRVDGAQFLFASMDHRSSGSLSDGIDLVGLVNGTVVDSIGNFTRDSAAWETLAPVFDIAVDEVRFVASSIGSAALVLDNLVFSPSQDEIFNDRFEEFTLNQAGDWACNLGEICQDVFEVEIEAGSVVRIDLTDITGSSDARIAALRPGAPLDAANRILDRPSDFSCAGQDMNESARFIADVGGVWQIVIGRDWDLSAGSSGNYGLEIQSNRAFLGGLTLAQNDVTSQAESMLCRGEYRITGSWNCSANQSCQDVFTLGLESGAEVSLSATNLTGNSVPRFALHAPTVPLGGLNLLTNTTDDRECVGQDVDDLPPAFRVRDTGTHTLALTRDWGSSAGASGTYELSVSAGDGVFSTPLRTDNDFNSLASGSRCGWVWESASNWSCLGGEDCQDVYDIELDRGTTPEIQVTGVTGNSVVRLALFEPGVPLSGTNTLTGSNLDYSCGGQDVSETPPPAAIDQTGTHRLAVGRDWGSSAGSSGNYLARVEILDGYGGQVTQTINDTQSLSTGFTCP